MNLSPAPAAGQQQNATDSQAIANREIRVFISSTFSDMQDERNYLVKKIFPEIQRECLRRNVTFTPLDLRWGITEEESRSGRVVEICMNEIRRTRPFFIGLVGGRYGWVPGENETADFSLLAERYPWIAGAFDAGKSITEMEMLFGVLDVEEPVHSHFFLRTDTSIPRQFRETDPAIEAKRQALKKRIRTAASRGQCSVSDYSSLKQLGKCVRKQLLAMLDELFPDNKNISAPERAFLHQKAKVNERRRIYFSEQKPNFEELFNHCDHILLSGDSGNGKSAAIANCLPDFCDGSLVVNTEVDENVASLQALRQQFYLRLREAHPDIDISAELADEGGEIPFEDTLAKFPQENYIWVIDSPERLSNVAERNLAEILKTGKNRIRFIISCSDDQILDRIKSVLFHNEETKVRLIWQVSLTPAELIKITELYLGAYGKKLNNRQMSSLSATSAIYGAGQLRAFLKILVNFGVYEDIDRFINRFTTLRDHYHFYNELIKYLEEEHGREVMEEIIKRLLLSPTGISEEGLFKGIVKSAVEQSAIFGSLEPFVIHEYGNLRINDVLFRQTAEERYQMEKLTGDERHRLARILISDYRKSLRDISKSDRKSNLITWALPKIYRGVKIIGDKNLSGRYNRLYSQLAVQYLHIDDLDGFTKLARHFGAVAFCFDAEYSKDILQLLSNKKIEYGRLFDSFDIWTSPLVFDDSYAFLSFWSILASRNEEEKKKFIQALSRKVITRKRRDKILDTLGLVRKSHGTLLESFEAYKSDPDNIGLGRYLIHESPFLLSWDSDNSVISLLDGLTRLLEKDDCESGFHLIAQYARALCLIRLGRLRHVENIVREFKSSEFFGQMQLLVLFTDALIERNKASKFFEELDVINQEDIRETFNYILMTVLRQSSDNLVLTEYGTPSGNVRLSAFYMAAKALNNLGYYSESEAMFRQVLTWNLSGEERSDTCMRVAGVLGRQIKYEQAFEFLDKAQRIAETEKLDSGAGGLEDIAYDRFNMAHRSGNLKEMEKACDLYDSLFARTRKESLEIFALNRRGVYLGLVIDNLSKRNPECAGTADFQQKVRRRYEIFKRCFDMRHKDINAWSNFANAALLAYKYSIISNDELRPILQSGEEFGIENIDPSNTEYYASLGKIYYHLGENDKFMATVRRSYNAVYFDRVTQNIPMIYNDKSERAIKIDIYYAYGIYADDLFKKVLESEDVQATARLMGDIIDDMAQCEPASYFAAKWEEYSTAGDDLHSSNLNARLLNLLSAWHDGDKELQKRITMEVRTYAFEKEDREALAKILFVFDLMANQLGRSYKTYAMSREDCLKLIASRLGITEADVAAYRLIAESRVEEERDIVRQSIEETRRIRAEYMKQIDNRLFNGSEVLEVDDILKESDNNRKGDTLDYYEQSLINCIRMLLLGNFDAEEALYEHLREDYREAFYGEEITDIQPEQLEENENLEEDYDGTIYDADHGRLLASLLGLRHAYLSASYEDPGCDEAKEAADIALSYVPLIEPYYPRYAKAIRTILEK